MQNFWWMSFRYLRYFLQKSFLLVKNRFMIRTSKKVQPILDFLFLLLLVLTYNFSLLKIIWQDYVRSRVWFEKMVHILLYFIFMVKSKWIQCEQMVYLMPLLSILGSTSVCSKVNWDMFYIAILSISELWTRWKLKIYQF